jgi:hypothetical protein
MVMAVQLDPQGGEYVTFTKGVVCLTVALFLLKVSPALLLHQRLAFASLFIAN